MVTLQFSSNRTIGSKLICWFTWSDYSHVDFVLPDGNLLGARGDGVKIRSPYGSYERVDRYYVDAPESVLDVAMTQLGKPYDYSAILGFLFRRDWQNPHHWFCDELVEWAFEREGYPLVDRLPTHTLTPRDLLLSGKLLESPDQCINFP